MSDSQSAALKLGATHVLQSSIERSGDKVLLTANLLDTATRIPVRTLAGEYGPAALGQMRIALAGLVTAAFGEPSAAGDEKLSPAAYPYYARGLSINSRFRKSPDLAISEFQQAIALDSNSPLPYVGLSEAYAAKKTLTGDAQWYQQARHAIREAESRNPDSAAVHVGAGRLDITVGWMDKAAEHYRRAIVLEPGDVEAWRGLALAYKSTPGRDAETAQTYRKALELDPGSVRIHDELGVFYFQRGNLSEAEREFRAATGLAPSFAAAHTHLCGVYASSGRYGEAESACRRTLELEPSAAAYNNLGATLPYQNRDAEAVDYYRRAAELDPSEFIYSENLGDSNRRLRHLAQASRDYRQCVDLAGRALNLNPSSGQTRGHIGYCAARLGDSRSGRNETAQALNLAPADVQVKRIAVLTCEALGDRKQSNSILRDAPAALLRELDRHPDLAGLRLDPEFILLRAQKH